MRKKKKLFVRIEIKVAIETITKEGYVKHLVMRNQIKFTTEEMCQLWMIE